MQPSDSFCNLWYFSSLVHSLLSSKSNFWIKYEIENGLMIIQILFELWILFNRMLELLFWVKWQFVFSRFWFSYKSGFNWRHKIFQNTVYKAWLTLLNIDSKWLLDQLTCNLNLIWHNLEKVLLRFGFLIYYQTLFYNYFLLRNHHVHFYKHYI